MDFAAAPGKSHGDMPVSGDEFGEWGVSGAGERDAPRLLPTVARIGVVTPSADNPFPTIVSSSRKDGGGSAARRVRTDRGSRRRLFVSAVLGRRPPDDWFGFMESIH
jgi:hypothetical protein